jgi:glycosyltransferase involved in cell wall biosynthesis
LEIVALGAAPEFRSSPDPAADAEASRFVEEAAAPPAIYLLHVGSVAPRKRINVLLQTFAAVHRRMPQTRFIRVGGRFDVAQEILLNRLDIKDSVTVLPGVRRDVLAALYRRAAVVLLPSEREGYGLSICRSHGVWNARGRKRSASAS